MAQLGAGSSLFRLVLIQLTKESVQLPMQAPLKLQAWHGLSIFRKFSCIPSPLLSFSSYVFIAFQVLG